MYYGKYFGIENKLAKFTNAPKLSKYKNNTHIQYYELTDVLFLNSFISRYIKYSYDNDILDFIT